MDKFLIRKDVYDELIEKGYGKRDLSKLTKKQITDKNGHKRTVYVKNGENPAAQNQPKAQEELSPEKKARYEEMLEKVKNGPDENALFVRSKGMLNKKDAIAHLEGKLGKKISSAAEKKQGYDYQDLRETGKLPEGLNAKQLREIRDKAKNDGSQDENTRQLYLDAQERLDEISRENYAKKHSQDDMKENYLDARNEAGNDIAENNKINKLSDMIEFSPEEMKMIKETAAEIGYRVGRDEGYLLNTINSKDKAMYSALTKKNQDAWDKSGKRPKTFSSTDLLKEKIKSMNGNFVSDNTEFRLDFDLDDTKKVSFEDSVKEYNFTDTKKNQFAMDEVANFYPELKDVVDKRRQAFREVSDAEKKLKINPNNKEYKDNFANAYNKLKQADAEYDKASKKALEKAPKIKKPDFNKYMDAKRDVQKFLDKYKQQSEEYEVGQRLRNNGASFLSPMYGLKPDDYTKDPNYIKAQMTIRAYEDK